MHGEALERSLLLATALLALGLGPVIYWLGRRARSVLDGLDGFVLVSVGSLVLLEVLPEATRAAGGWAWLAAGLGLVFPLVLEQVFEDTEIGGAGLSTATRLLLFVAFAGLLVHATLDGVALAGIGAEQGHEHGHGEHEGPGIWLALAVIFHRLPVGLALWWIVRPSAGPRFAATALGLLGLTTILGFTLAERLFTLVGSQGVSLFQAFMAGALLHVVVHKPGHGHGGRTYAEGHQPGPSTRWQWAAALGALLGLLPMLLIPAHGEHGAIHTYGQRYVQWALACAPPLLLGLTLAGVVFGLGAGPALPSLDGRAGPLGLLRGLWAGSVRPVCSCDLLPQHCRLVDRRISGPAALGFFWGSALIGVESLVLSLWLLGAPFTAWRVGLTVIVGVAVVGLATLAILRRTPSRDHHHRHGLSCETVAIKETGLAAGLRYAAGEFLADIAPYVLLGLAVAAALDARAAAWFATTPDHIEVVALTLLGLPLFISALGATPLAAALLMAGLSPGGVLAFLLVGPAVGLDTLREIRHGHGIRSALTYALLCVFIPVGAGLGANALFTQPVAQLTPKAPGAAPWWHWASLAALVGAYGFVLLQRGPRALLASLAHLGRHDHAPEPAHTHGFGELRANDAEGRQDIDPSAHT